MLGNVSLDIDGRGSQHTDSNELVVSYKNSLFFCCFARVWNEKQNKVYIIKNAGTIYINRQNENKII